MPDSVKTLSKESEERLGVGVSEPCRVQLSFKRLTDFVMACGVAIAFMPLMLLIACLIKVDSAGPIVFTQRRVGKNGELFDIYKFRTMRQGTPNLPTDEMLKLPSPVTKIGKFLRATSLDELPQIFNVLKNDMSIVGPRPALYNQVGLTEMRSQARVLRFLPGITGWAQVNGRDELPDDIKVEMDKWYCDHWNYWLDWKILFRTVQAVLSRRGVN